MSKYNLLWNYLQSNGNDLLKLSFEEIKNVLGFELDHSFLTYKKEAEQYGYRVGKISLKEKHVTFMKLDEPAG